MANPKINAEQLDVGTGANQIIQLDGSGNLPAVSGAALTGTGNIVQIVYVMDGNSSFGATTIPEDDTIPQVTEGFECMTLAITPTNASNILKIDVVIAETATANAAPTKVTAALFNTDFHATNAMAVAIGGRYGGAGAPAGIIFTHYMTAGVTSASTFKVRLGDTTGSNVTFNGKLDGARVYGGALASSITITEIKV